MKSKLEISLAVAAWLTALAALGTAIWQGVVAQRHQKLSVQPAITFHEGWSHENDFVGLIISNQGLGPAVMKPLLIFVSEDRVNNWDELVVKLDIDNSDSWLTQFEIAGDVPLKAGIDRYLFGVVVNDQDYSEERKDMVFSALEQINIVACFCSMYNECDQSSLRDTNPNICSIEYE